MVGIAGFDWECSQVLYLYYRLGGRGSKED